MVFIKNGFAYYDSTNRKESRNVTHYTCINHYRPEYERCSGEGQKINDDDESFVITVPHSCDSEPDEQALWDSHTALMTRAKSFPRYVFNCIDDNGIFQRAAIKRARRFPKLRGLSHTYDILTKHDYYVQRLHYNDSSRLTVQLIEGGITESLLFYDPDFFNKFTCAKGTIFLHRTFSKVSLIDDPANLQKYQLVIIQGYGFGYPFPIAWVIMESRTELDYRVIFDVLFKDSLHFSGQVITDIEFELRTGLQQLMPKSSLSGCHFHYSESIQVWLRSRPSKIQNMIKNDLDAKQFIRYVILLRYLPADDIEPAFEHLCSKLSAQHQQIFDNFVQYYRSYWLHSRGPKDFCLHRNHIKANDTCKTYERRLIRLLTTFPAFDSFMDHMLDITRQSIREYRSACRGIRIEYRNTARFRKWKEIHTNWEKYEQKEISIDQFLCQMDFVVNKTKKTVNSIIEDDHIADGVATDEWEYFWLDDDDELANVPEKVTAGQSPERLARISSSASPQLQSAPISLESNESSELHSTDEQGSAPTPVSIIPQFKNVSPGHLAPTNIETPKSSQGKGNILLLPISISSDVFQLEDTLQEQHSKFEDTPVISPLTQLSNPHSHPQIFNDATHHPSVSSLSSSQVHQQKLPSRLNFRSMKINGSISPPLIHLSSSVFLQKLTIDPMNPPPLVHSSSLSSILSNIEEENDNIEKKRKLSEKYTQRKNKNIL